MAIIVTVTSNPAIDVSTTVNRVEPVSEFRCRERREPGGGGINVARAINRLGSEVVAVYPAGGAPYWRRSRAGLSKSEGLRDASHA